MPKLQHFKLRPKKRLARGFVQGARGGYGYLWQRHFMGDGEYTAFFVQGQKFARKWAIIKNNSKHCSPIKTERPGGSAQTRAIGQTDQGKSQAITFKAWTALGFRLMTQCRRLADGIAGAPSSCQDSTLDFCEKNAAIG